jgi:DNA replication protein DnaC
MKKKSPNEPLRQRVKALGLHGLVAGWEDFGNEPWLPGLVKCEETERQRRSLERRQANAHIGRFKPMSDFNWSWPDSIDRAATTELFQLGFLDDATNVVVVGPNGIGKTMIAQNLAHQAVVAGHTVRFVSASEILNDLASQDGTTGLHRRLKRYCQPQLLVIDELGYLSYDDRHADLLFEIISRRYGEKSIAITTNKAFAEWNEVFPNASCVVALVDRLVHQAEIINIAGESYRLKEAKEREDKQRKARAAKSSAARRAS